jgi:hypothetical protein
MNPRAVPADATAIKSLAEPGFEVIATAGIAHTQHFHDHETQAASTASEPLIEAAESGYTRESQATVPPSPNATARMIARGLTATSGG